MAGYSANEVAANPDYEALRHVAKEKRKVAALNNLNFDAMKKPSIFGWAFFMKHFI